MVQVLFRYKRHQGMIMRSDNGQITVEVEGQPTLKKKIAKLLREYQIKKLIPFKHPGIPGKIKQMHGIESEQDFQEALKFLEEETEIWIYTKNSRLTDMPWFGDKGFNLVKFNGDQNCPWWVIEDLATGLEALITNRYSKAENLHWFIEPISVREPFKDWDYFEFELEDTTDLVF